MTNPSEKRKADALLYRNGAVPDSAAHTRQEEVRQASALEGVHHGMTLPNREDVLVGRPGCQHCEVLPAPLRGPGTVHLRFPHTYTLGKILGYLAKSSWQHREQGGSLSVFVPSGSLAPLLAPIMDCLSSAEQRDARAMFQPEGQLLQVSDYFEIAALPHFVYQARADWLLDVLRAQRLYCVYQPIVHCAPVANTPSANMIYGYECLMRAQVEGEVVSPGVMLDLALGAGLLFQVDLAARRAAITGAAQHNIRQKVFINFSPNSIYNPYTCLDSTVAMIDEVGLQREQVVFEIIESERLPEMSHMKRIMNFYREKGFGVALDDVGAGYSSLAVLLELRPDYIKIDKTLIQGVHADADKAVVVGKLIEMAQHLNIQTIAEGIETQAEADWAKEQGADYLQGYFFARPATPPPAIPSPLWIGH